MIECLQYYRLVGGRAFETADALRRFSDFKATKKVAWLAESRADRIRRGGVPLGAFSRFQLSLALVIHGKLRGFVQILLLREVAIGKPKSPHHVSDDPGNRRVNYLLSRPLFLLYLQFFSRLTPHNQMRFSICSPALLADDYGVGRRCSACVLLSSCCFPIGQPTR